MKRASERTEIGAWLVDQRKRLGVERGKPFRQQDVVDGLAEMGYPIDASYYRGIEGGSKKPGRELVERLADFFNTRPPIESRDRTGTDLSEVVAAIREQTSAISGLVAAVQELVTAKIQPDEEQVRVMVERLLREGRPGDVPPPPQPGTRP